MFPKMPIVPMIIVKMDNTPENYKISFIKIHTDLSLHKKGDSADMCAEKFPLVSMEAERGPPSALAEISGSEIGHILPLHASIRHSLLCLQNACLHPSLGKQLIPCLDHGGQ